MDYQTQVQSFAHRIERLPRNRQAFVFTVLAKSLQPARDGESPDEARRRSAVETAINIASDFAVQAQLQDNGSSIEALQAVVPHGDDISTAEEFCLQCMIVVVAAALRAASHGETVSGELVEYALAPLHSYLCERDLGVMDVGSSQRELAWEAELPHEPAMREALRFVDSAVVAAEDEEPVSLEEIEAMSRSGGVLMPPPMTCCDHPA
ncbi:hypothetical protein ACWCQN_47880 [Streptomyces sp. NPDC001984]|uniref:hypothetical protein n=1 Tax=Streptomyces sp. NPDC002619 TaxID=3364655 RepID=UPI00367739C4